MHLPCSLPTWPAGTWRGLARLALAACTLALAACGAVRIPMSIEAPLRAGGVLHLVDGYRPADPDGLAVDAQSRSFLRFSLATLPTATYAFPDGASAPQATSTGLSGARIASARLVLFAQRVDRTGALQLQALQRPGAAPGVDCWPREQAQPVCQPATGLASAGKDPDTGADVLVSAPGYYSFDVTAAVRQWVDQPGAQQGFVLWADAVAGLQAQFAGQASTGGALRGPQLRVTFKGMLGYTFDVDAVTTVDEAAPTVSGGTTLLQAGGAAGARRFALASFRSLSSGSFGLGAGASVSAHLSARVAERPDAATPSPALRAWYSGVPVGSVRGTTWSSWTAPGVDDAMGTAALDAAADTQAVVVDLSEGYARVRKRGGSSPPQDMRLALDSNAQEVPLSLVGQPAADAGAPMRLAWAYGPFDPDGEPPWPFGLAVVDDSRRAWRWRMREPVDMPCEEVPGGLAISSQVLRARVGQALPRFALTLHAYESSCAEPGVVPSPQLAVPMHLQVPDDPAAPGARAERVDYAATDIDQESLFRGFVVQGLTANSQPGSYYLEASAPGHNARMRIPVQNLPLPGVTLTAPAGPAVLAPAGNGGVQLGLSVDDPAAQEDATTTWRFSSSDALAVLPPDMPLGGGSQAVSVVFGSPGMHTVTVTSVGDASIHATVAVQVIASGSIAAEVLPGPAAGTLVCSPNPGDARQASECSVDAAPGFAIAAVSGCGGEALGPSASPAAYATAPVAAACTVTARFVPDFTGPLAPVPQGGAPGQGHASFTGGGPDCRFDLAQTGFIAALPLTSTAPTDPSLPQGLFQFRLQGCDTSGAPVRMTIIWPEPVTGYAKYGLATPDAQQRSFFAPRNLVIDGQRVSFDVVDGALGDDDWQANGVIVDPTGPTGPSVQDRVTAVPGLAPGGLALLALGLVVLARRRISR